MTKNEFIEKYIDIPEESCDYIPLKKEMESDLNTLIETLLTEYQALQLQQTGVSGRSEQLIDFCKYVNKTMNCSFLEEMANEYINKINCH